MIKKFKAIYKLIPDKFQKKSIWYMILSIANVFFDLLSIAYIIPLFIFILDKEQMPEFLKKISFFNEEFLLYWVAGIMLLFIVKNYVQIAIVKFQSKLVFDIATSLSSGLTKTFLKSPLNHIQHLDKGKEIQKIQMSGTDFSNHILLSINVLFTELTVIGVIGIVSFLLYPKFSLLIFFIALLCLYSLYRVRRKKIQSLSASIRKSYSTATSHLLNIIDGYLEIKSLRKESFFEIKYEETLGQFNSNFAVLKKHQNSNAKYLEIFLILGLCLFLYYINLSFGTSNEKVVLISYLAGISFKLFPSLNKLIIAYTNFRGYSYTIDLLSKKSKVIPGNSQQIDFKKSLSLNDISYSYDENQKLLSNLSLKIQRGEIIGIKGRSGIGKTTLLYLVMGFIEPQEGALLVDDIEIIDNSNILPFIGYVPQQPFLFQGSLLDNIVMGAPNNEIDFQKIDSLINSFELTSFVQNLEDGLETKISHDSLSVSGGQKQRIALIRALYSNPQLLILDEVTNQLDEDLEVKTLHFLKEYARTQNIAILLVSHASIVSSVCARTYEITDHTLKSISK